MLSRDSCLSFCLCKFSTYLAFQSNAVELRQTQRHDDRQLRIVDFIDKVWELKKGGSLEIRPQAESKHALSYRQERA